MQPPREEPTTALIPRDALRELIVASEPEDQVEPPPLYLIGIALAAVTLFVVIFTRF
jgi:hypothetical protein